MNMNRKLDKILNILYDEKNFLWKKVPTIDIVMFAKQKYNIKWEVDEIIFIMEILKTEGYVIQNQTTPESLLPPTYSLTTKGILLKQNGGFIRKREIEWLRNFLILSASIVTIIVGLVTSIDFYEKLLKSNVKNYTNNHKCNNNKPNNDTSNNSRITIFKSDTIAQPIKKSNVRSTNKK
jgi:hypothetical protein